LEKIPLTFDCQNLHYLAHGASYFEPKRATGHLGRKWKFSGKNPKNERWLCEQPSLPPTFVLTGGIAKLASLQLVPVIIHLLVRRTINALQEAQPPYNRAASVSDPRYGSCFRMPGE
jgi:hypothetical protein